jgi:hypothetical protein
MLEGQIDRIFAGERWIGLHDGPNVETQGSPTHLNLLHERLCEWVHRVSQCGYAMRRSQASSNELRGNFLREM